MIAGLHDHGEYSLLDGAGTADQHVAAAKAAGYGALIISDHGTLAGTIHHMRACREGGIHPIIGCELYYRPNRKVQGQKEWLRNYNHMTVFAKDLVGWKSLCSLVSECHSTGFYGKACADLELLERYKDGIVCMTGCLGGVLAKAIVGEDERGAEAWIRQLQRIYRDDLFVEIMPHDLDEQRAANAEAVQIAQSRGVPVVATIDAHYPTAEWASTQDILLMIATNQSVKKREKKREEGEDVYEFSIKTLYHQTREEIESNFAQFHPRLSDRIVQESINNTLVAASRALPFDVDRTEKMPIVSFPGEESNSAYLRRLVFEGLARRGYAGDPEYTKDLDFELATFEEHGVVDYMLLVWDIVDWSKSDRPVPKRKGGTLIYEGKKEPIMVSPGRGSAAGSKGAWCLGITGVNPKKHNMLFERFLNPDRKGLPDIDLDFPPDRVDEVEAYVKARYGKDKVVDIIAHSTFGPRACITDVGRVLSIPYDHVRAVTKTIDDKERGDLDVIRVVNEKLDKWATQYPVAYEEAKRLQGQVARKSEHAGGLLIMPGPVSDFIPVERTGGQKGKLLSAFGARSGKGNDLISALGLMKVDILRVAELTKQAYACDLIYQRTGKRIVLDDLPVHDDPYAVEDEVMQGFADGLFVGVFQWTGVAQKLTRQIKPRNLFDLAAINALIRPGPRGAEIDQKFARRARGEEAPTPWHPVLEPYLNWSQGLMVFQEQLVQVVHALGGMTLAEADLFRKIASKLYRTPDYAREVMKEQFDKIRIGLTKAGLDPDEIEAILSELLSFCDYSFNLSHADSYALMAYRDMWLKVHYPREFYAAFLSKGLSQVTKKRSTQKQDAAREVRHVGLKIMPPDVNESWRDYTVVEGGIRFGLMSIKNIGPAGAAALEEHRPFASYEDLEKRVPPRAVNSVAKASLIMSGAFDKWGMRDRFTEERIDEVERDLLGMSVTSTYSIAQYASVIDGQFWTEDEVDAADDGTPLAIAGEVINVKEFIDKKGETMAFVDVAYGPNVYNVTIFSHFYEEYGELLRSRRPIMVTGEKNLYKGKASIKVKTLPADDDGEVTKPIMDFQDYVEMIADQEESFAQDSVFPEDLGLRGEGELVPA